MRGATVSPTPSTSPTSTYIIKPYCQFAYNHTALANHLHLTTIQTYCLQSHCTGSQPTSYDIFGKIQVIPFWDKLGHGMKMATLIKVRLLTQGLVTSEQRYLWLGQVKLGKLMSKNANRPPAGPRYKRAAMLQASCLWLGQARIGR